MRIVAVADTHTFEGQLRHVPMGDVFIHAGDMCRHGTIDEFRPVCEWLRQLPHRHKIVVAGNHDRVFESDPDLAIEMLGPTVHYLMDSGMVIDGIRFWGSPWTIEYNQWAFNLPRGSASRSKWDSIPDGVDVLITHGPPCGIGDFPDNPARRGCEELLKAVQRVKPRLHLFGHSHHGGGFSLVDGVTFANVSTSECERVPSVFDVDLRSRAVHIIR